MNRCLGVVLGYITGKGSADVQRETGFPPPWTLLDAQVYLGRNGYGFGLGLEPDSPTVGEVDLDDFDIGSIVIVPGPSGETVTLQRRGNELVTPLMHCLLYRGGEWLEPRDGEIMGITAAPEKILQVWPVYVVKGG